MAIEWYAALRERVKPQTCSNCRTGNSPCRNGFPLSCVVWTLLDDIEKVHAHLLTIERERDEARAEAEGWWDLAKCVLDCFGREPMEPLPWSAEAWDANANGTIDNAEELAAYAEQAGLGLEDIEREARSNTAWKASLGAMPDLPEPEEDDRGTDIWSLASREDRCTTWEGALEDAYCLLAAGREMELPVIVEEYRHATPDDVNVVRLAVWTWDRLGEWLSEDDRLCHDDGGPELGEIDKESPAWAALVEAIRVIVHDHCDLDDTAAVATGRQRRVMLTEDGDGVRWEDV